MDSTTSFGRARRGATALFLREALMDIHEVGAVAPSSSALAAALAAPLDDTRRPRSVLEVGAGTGSVTAALVRRLGNGDRLDVVEANPRFASRLHALYADAHLSGGPRVRVHRTRIELFTVDHDFDVVVSGLPFANFDPTLVRAITDRYRDLLVPDGTVSYFSYAGTTLALPGSARRRAVGDVLETYRRTFDAQCRTVWANIPPARVWHLRAGAASRTAGC